MRLIHGDDDEFVPVHHARRLTVQLPDAVLSVVTGAGHMDLIAASFNDAVDWLITQQRH